MNLQLTDLYIQPENKKNDPDYAALFAFNGEGVFTVDLAKSEAKRDYIGKFDRLFLPPLLCAFQLLLRLGNRSILRL